MNAKGQEGDKPLLLQPYIRTSTSDRNQNPARQAQVIGRWAARHGASLLTPVIDEGTSASKTDPFERPLFIEASLAAERAGAAGVVVEMGDRFTRQGTKLASWAEVELERRYGLALYRADKPLGERGTMVGDLTDALRDELAREEMTKHRQRVRSGMEAARKKGKRVGRPRKELTEEEIELALCLRREGLGWRRVAQAINERRGAAAIYDPAARRRRSVSEYLLRQRLGGEPR